MDRMGWVIPYSELQILVDEIFLGKKLHCFVA